MAVGTKRGRDEDDFEEELDAPNTRSRVIVDGSDSDSGDEEGGSHRARWAKKDGDGAKDNNDEEDDMFAAADKPEPKPAKEAARTLKLSEIDGQEFGGRTLEHSDDEDNDELDPEYALVRENADTEYQDANADAERTPPGSPRERQKRGMGFKIDGFNMKSELANGQFDEEGNYTWNKRDPYAQSDRWLEGNYSRKQIRAAGEAQRSRQLREQQRAREQQAKYPTEAHALKALAEILEPGESVLEGLQAAGAAKRSNGARAAQLDLFTDLTAVLMSDFGLMNIYDETYEGIVRQVRRAGIVPQDWDPNRRETQADASPDLDTRTFEYKWAPSYLAAMARANGSNVDPETRTFGPFPRDDLVSWAQQGYFGADRENIRVRQCGHTDWLSWADAHVE